VPAMLQRIRRIWTGVFALSAVALIGYVLEEHRGTLETLRLVKPWMLALCAVLHVGFWFMATAFWRLTVLIATHKTLRLGESFHQLALVAIGKYLPGKIWGFLARSAALKDSSTSNHDVIAAAAIEQWVMLMSAALTSGALLVAIHPNVVLIWLGSGGVFLGLTGNHLFAFGSRLLQRLFTSKLNVQGLETTISLSHEAYLQLMAVHSLMWVILGAVLAALCGAFALNPLSLEFCAALVLANTLGIVIGFAAIFAPGGLGVREMVTTAVLLPYVPLEQAAILSIAFRLWITVSDALIAVMLALQALRSPRHSKR
jgi:glycosyltransferase 2 family protein